MKVGTHFMYEGNEFVCTGWDGFILTADNVDSKSNVDNIMWVGCADITMKEDSFKILD